MDLNFEPPAIIAFGRFRVLPHRRELLADGQPIRLGGRAFDVLMALIEARGGVISKGALMTRVWPDQVVDENTLQAQVSALRVALGPERRLIRTVSGRGYQFTGEVRPLSQSPDESARQDVAAAERDAVLPPTNLPEPVSKLIGREYELAEILGRAAANRLVTLTGAGGIGKTRLALVVARRLLPQFADGVWLAEFSPVTDPGLLPATVAAAVGLELSAGEVSARRVAQALADRRVLLVLDTCEHVIAAAAELAEAILQAGSGVRIIATSREPLRAEGEQIYPVPPLPVPAASGEDPWQYGAVQLFAVRWAESGVRVSEDPDTGATLTAVCRRLDGIPLAIELAAARAPTIGIQRVAARLDDRFHLLTGGRRTALPRHQTLRATLDWSYDLLDEPERAILRRLAVFAGAFSLEGAMAVAPSPEIAPAEVVVGLVSLVAKSLIVAELERTVARYRLLDTTHGYALEKLVESDEREGAQRRHAEYYCHLFEQAEAEWETRPIAEWLADYAQQVDNLRAALDWAFSPGGDASIGVALTAAAIPLWQHLSLLDECCTRVEQALSKLTAGAGRDPGREMKLHAALAASSLYTKGAYTKGAVHERGAAWTKALEIAESLHDAEYQLRSLWGLWAFHLLTGQFRITLGIAQRFCTLTADRPDPNDRLIANRMIGVSQHFLGDQASARRQIERMLTNFVPTARGPHYATRFQVDQRVAARTYLARILWLQGSPDQAIRTAESAVDDARATNHAISMCFALAHGACLITLWVGDLSATERYAGMLLDHSTHHALPAWRALGLCYQGMLLIRRGDIPGGLRMLHAGFDGADEGLFAANHVMFLGEMAEDFGRAGRIVDALAAVEQAIARSEHNEERWLIAELLRVKGELLLLQAPQGTAPMAENHFRQALDWARRQGDLAWELRAATSFARLLRDQGRSTEAVALLQPVYDRFTEGFDTADLKAAGELLNELGS
jgi:predicted ATPase/DNA-binding winged helix-turn-helix (wHTH) protein